MAYNTNNPVGSTDPRDLYDNAGNLDKFVNGDAPLYPDRLGQQRKSWSGMEADFSSAQEGREAAFDQFLEASAFIWIGDYGTGLTFTSRSQYTVRDGYAYRLAESTTIPYTSTGNWALEQTRFSLVNSDDILRQDLAEPGGADRVGAIGPTGSATTVQHAIENISNEYPVAAYSQNAGALQTGPMIVNLQGKIRSTNSPSDAAYNFGVLSAILAGLPNGAELQMPARGLFLCDGGLIVDSIGVSLRGSNSGGAYDSAWLKFNDGADALTVKKAGFHMHGVLLVGASDPTTGFGSDVAHDCLNFEMPALNCDAVISNSGLAFFRDLVTVKNATARNIRINDSTFSGSRRCFSYTHLGSVEARDFEFYDNRYHGIGRESHVDAAIIYCESGANVRGVTICGGLADFSVELMRGYASNTNIKSVAMKGAQRGYIAPDSTGHAQGFDRRGFIMADGSYQMDGNRAIPSSAVSLKGTGGFYAIDGFVSYGSSGHGVEVESIDACVSNTLIHNASQFADAMYSGYYIGGSSARVTFAGCVEYKQGAQTAPANKAKYAVENFGAGTRFSTQVNQFGLLAASSYFIQSGKVSFGPDPRIQARRTAYADTVPTTGTWTAGDRVVRETPLVGSPKAWVCTAGGTPGTWVSEGVL
ncbi:hypothetical protein UIA24_20560 [Pseudomonas sp. AL 58]|uniref:hypothetical protein n=1 Tax=Pseudomonas sp. AL 58 TaxID=3104275 RepID=UPI002ECF3DC4|nr:hypothetical protein [Pseudomonas sp. AL 58]